MIHFSVPDALRILSKTPGLLRLWLADLPLHWLQATEGKDTFSPLEVVGHLIHGEKTDWIPRMQLILAYGDSRPFEPFDRFAQRELSRGKNIGQLLDEFEAERARCLQILRDADLNDEHLNMRGRHPSLGSVTLRNLLATWVTHDMAHLAQIARIMAKQYKTEVGPWLQFMNILNDRNAPGDSDYDWSRFTLRIAVARPVAEVFQHLSTRAGLESWFLRQAIFTSENGVMHAPEQPVAANDRYAWRWHGWPDETQEHGVVLDNNGRDTLRFTFAGNCFVTLKVSPHGALSLVELTQENIPTDENSRVKIHHGCSTGWLFYLTNLKSLLEGGLDLRNKDVALQGVLNA